MKTTGGLLQRGNGQSQSRGMDRTSDGLKTRTVSDLANNPSAPLQNNVVRGAAEPRTLDGLVGGTIKEDRP
jgi:hypothetical protein